MQQIATTTSGDDGAFSMDATPQGVALVQADFQGVTYTMALPPGTPTTGLQVSVYNVVPVRPELETTHLILLEPTLTELSVSDTYFVVNGSAFTWQSPQGGSLLIYLPEGLDPAGLEVTIDSLGVPVTRPLQPVPGSDAYTVAYAIRPGETRFDLKYQLPPAESFAVRTDTQPTRLITPANVMISAEGIRELGVEPSTQARVYETSLPEVNVALEGIGALASNIVGDQETGAPVCCDEVPARLNTQSVAIVAMAFAILALGGLILFRRSQAGTVPANPGASTETTSAASPTAQGKDTR